jgi:cyclopropane fatty-acyl-phospholipid synthase-like methyltransferase
MSASFDSAAYQYDEIFTNTAIGKLQRARVWNYLESILPDKTINILELNCGTGEDAIWFANKGHKVLATDISEKMISITKEKMEKLNLKDKVRTQQLDINEIDKISTINKFDLIFSNFGGLNCLTESELVSLSNKIKDLLNPKGKFISVVMPDFCMIESLYFLLKLKLNFIFRRKRMQQVKMNNSIVDTNYYHPNRFYKFYKDNFRVNQSIAVGVFIPPSYLEKFFRRKKILLTILNRLENILGNNSFAAAISDHYLIDLDLIK